jgi:hypothetical protein
MIAPPDSFINTESKYSRAEHLRPEQTKGIAQQFLPGEFFSQELRSMYPVARVPAENM